MNLCPVVSRDGFRHPNTSAGYWILVSSSFIVVTVSYLLLCVCFGKMWPGWDFQ